MSKEPTHRIVEPTNELESWRECVGQLIGPRMVGEGPALQRHKALNLAAAALDFAGETSLADEVRERIEDMA